MIRGCASHTRSNIRYWEHDGVLAEEAFAEMFESQFDEMRYENMKMYFPNALHVFEKMLKEVI